MTGKENIRRFRSCGRTLIIAACLIMAATGNSYAQHRVQNFANINISSLRTELNGTGDSLKIRMAVEATDLRIRDNRSLTLSIRLADRNNSILLPAAMYTGKSRYRFDRRENILEGRDDGDLHKFVGVSRKRPYRLIYETSVPYAHWMDAAALEAEYRYHDCCTSRLLQSYMLLPDVGQAVRLAQYQKKGLDYGPELFERMVSFTKPAIRQRYTERGSEQLVFHFPTNNYTIDYSVKANVDAVKRLDKLLSGESRDRLTAITVIGYASPEGAYYRNGDLAGKRSKSIAEYIINRYNVGHIPLESWYVAEDWDRLHSVISETAMSEKNDILRIIENVGIFDGREKVLMELNGGSTYRKLLKEYFPGLRRTEVTLSFMTDGMDAAEAERLLQEKPEELTPNEIFLAASRYHESDRRYRQIYEAAAALFPDNAAINNNAAAACLADGDHRAARRYLDRIGEGPETYINYGVCCYQENDIKTARKYFIKAINEGQALGTDNLLLLEKLD